MKKFTFLTITFLLLSSAMAFRLQTRQDPGLPPADEAADVLSIQAGKDAMEYFEIRFQEAEENDAAHWRDGMEREISDALDQSEEPSEQDLYELALINGYCVVLATEVNDNGFGLEFNVDDDRFTECLGVGLGDLLDDEGYPVPGRRLQSNRR